MKLLIKDVTVDWIVSANVMETLSDFLTKGYLTQKELLPLLHVQQTHSSKSVAKRASKYIAQLENI